jgi:hypothetical protein
MQLTEPNDPKMRLIKKSAKHRQQLEEEVEYISAQTEKALTNALVIGGTLVVTYFIVRQFSSSKRRKKSKAQKITLVQSTPEDSEVVHEEESGKGVMAQIGSALASQVAVVLLDLSREMLSEYIQAHFEKTEDEHS